MDRRLSTLSLTVALAAGAVAGAALTPGIAHAQEKVYVVGLKQLNQAQLRDTLKKKFTGPAATLGTPESVASLRQLGYVRVAIQKYGDATVVNVVEKVDSLRTISRPKITTTYTLPGGWEDALASFKGEKAGEQMAAVVKGMLLTNQGFADSANMVRAKAGVTADQAKLETFIKAHASGGDQAAAFDVLSRDSVNMHRALAAAVLSNFGDDSGAWAILIAALRDPSYDVPLVASAVLLQWSKKGDTIDWSQYLEDTKALIDGANLWILPDFMQTLVNTKIPKEMGTRLMRGSGERVLDIADLPIPELNRPARGLLKALSGEDNGANVDKWREWIKKMPRYDRYYYYYN